MDVQKDRIKMVSITESPSVFQHLDQMSVNELLTGMNQEDIKVPLIIKKIIPQIERLVNLILERMSSGGRVFYLGAGTSGRLGVLDASEIPPTFGVSPGIIIGLIAGGDGAFGSDFCSLLRNNTRRTEAKLYHRESNISLGLWRLIQLPLSAGRPSYDALIFCRSADCGVHRAQSVIFYGVDIMQILAFFHI